MGPTIPIMLFRHACRERRRTDCRLLQKNRQERGGSLTWWNFSVVTLRRCEGIALSGGASAFSLRFSSRSWCASNRSESAGGSKP